MQYPPLFGANGPGPFRRNLIEPTGGFKSRVIPRTPPQNFIRPFTRYKILPYAPSPFARLSLIWQAWTIGFTIGTIIEPTVSGWIKGLLDTSQPTKPVDKSSFKATTFEIPYDPAVSHSYVVTQVTKNFVPDSFRCSNDALKERGETKDVTTTGKAFVAYGIKYSSSQASLNVSCGDGGEEVRIEIGKLEAANSAGEWETKITVNSWEGSVQRDWYYNSPALKSWSVGVLTQDGEEVQIPKSYVVPEPEALPEVEPETLPQRVKPKKPVIAPPLPALVPGADPLNDPERLVPPVPIPAPAVPATAPAVKPATVPDTTQETDKEGNQVPPKLPPVPTTPKDVHTIGNAGGRIAGRTMRPTPVGIAQEVGRIEQKISQMNSGFPTLGGLGDILRLLLGLNELLNSQQTGTTYELKSVCECPSDEEACEEETTTISTSGGYYVDEILARIDAIPPLLQAHKDYKQPICNEKPELEGDFRTISFISDEVSPYGSNRLRKRFRYRSQSSIGLGGVVDHWKDFTWTAGDVCVQHSGHSWGTPQVWASNADEGKRVIQHAGREAGVDPDQVGKWTIGGSDNPRYGVSGTMRVCTKGGYYWITERLGSNGRPLVAIT